MARIALVGNPNCGKTTLFNSLTGGRQHVGNYPGVTVERHVGTYSLEGEEVEITDLPGTHSLSVHSDDELVVQQTLLTERFDLLVNVIESSHFHRNFYLSLELCSLGFPVLFVLNMTDEAETKGIVIDAERLAALTGCPVVKTVGRTGKGVAELKRAIAETLKNPPVPKLPDWQHQGDDHLRTAVLALAEQIAVVPFIFPSHPRPEWLVVKLLEENAEANASCCHHTDASPVQDHEHSCGGCQGKTSKRSHEHHGHHHHHHCYEKASAISDAYFSQHPELQASVQAASESVRAAQGERVGEAIAHFRYGIINALGRDCITQSAPKRRDVSMRIDSVVTNRWLGIPVFLLVMFGMFTLTFVASEPIMEWLEGVFEWLGEFLGAHWDEEFLPVLRALVIEGIIGGVGGVLVFIPNILILFFCLSLIEGTGYMARAAFIMDRAMRAVGLHGKSFIPLLVGFGCTVPAIMATRTIESRRDRLITLFVAPLMSCGARLPVYTLLIAAFFPTFWRAPVLISIYLVGVVAALIIAAIMRKTMFRGESSLFILEMPPYRMPTLRSVLVHMWERFWLYLKRAGTIILAASIIFWAATTYPDTGNPEDSVTGQVGHALEPVMSHIGFDWKLSSALVGAMAAKEAFISQLAIITAVGEDNMALTETLRKQYTPLQGYVLMLFILIATPCIATLAIVRRETNSWRWALGQQVVMTLLAYGVCFVVYNVAKYIIN